MEELAEGVWLGSRRSRVRSLGREVQTVTASIGQAKGCRIQGDKFGDVVKRGD